MLVRIFSLLVIGSLIVACGSSPGDSRGPIIVSAAVSLKDAFTELAPIYKQKTGRDVTFNFGSSGALQKQIETGAPADVFASAGKPQMDALVTHGSVDASVISNFTSNRLVLIVPNDSTLSIVTLSDLAGASIKRVAMGNSKTVPAGQYSEQALTKTNLLESLKPKLVFGEDVRQVLDYVSRGEVDAGLVYASDAAAAGEKVKVVYTVPAESHDPILYPIAVVKGSKNSDAAKAFVDLVLSPDGQNILKRHGFAGN